MDSLTAAVLKALLSTDGWEGLKDLVVDDTFTDPDVRRVYTHIKNLHEESVHDISMESLVLDMHSSYSGNEELLKRYLKITEAVDEAPIFTDEEIKRNVRRFVSRAKTLEASEYIATRCHSEDFDPAVPAALCQSAVDLWAIVDPAVCTLSDFGDPGEGDDRPGIVNLGLSSQLDDILGGGCAKGELAVVAAPPGRGKTSALIATGAAAARAGKTVLHITLEVSQRKVMRRYQQCWTRLTKEQMIANPSTVAAAQGRVRDAGGDVLIKDWSYEGVRVDDIFALVKRLKQKGHDIDVLIVDYLELVRADKAMMRRDPRFGMGQVAQDMRALSVALEMPVITAWQVNRAGSEKHIITGVDLSECWDIYKHADIMISLNQNEAQRLENIMRVHIIKQRESTTRNTVKIHWDLERCDIRDATEEELTEFESNDVEGTTRVLHKKKQ